jgi:L,D-transpeptidase catalytic domain/Sporulation and spore germination/Putative peptidoglycan binding domain
MATRFVIVAVLLAGIAAAGASAAVKPPTVDVTFVRNGKFVRVERVVPKGVEAETHAVRELLQGPTRAERRKGLRSALQRGIRLQSLRVDGNVWLVRFSRRFLGPATAKTMQRRLAQVARTLAPLGPQRYAAIAVEGRLATTIRIGVYPGAWRAKHGEKGYSYTVRGVQLRLWTLGFLHRESVNSSLDYLTEQALIAFQGWNGLSRTGTVTGETQVALFRSSVPKPFTHRSGRRVEIHRDRGVMLLVEGSVVRRAVHTSTGAYGATPAGTFRVYRKERLSWSVPFSVWMPYASYFVGGIAMHEYPYVPEYPASHGCVRLPAGEAERVYRFADYGTPVHVF